ncbi:MAG: UDP-N-acetylmuramoyl-L-alanyl-D-glutamate--2,6-diaminopimelate ligase [Lachnospiraceae bacterium]|nr:UDP-N-acetylmuramoyl-L-alanyl-D-glutamate--2,6-diaminopimelate ligase [Lachnospiraceae bacterium]
MLLSSLVEKLSYDVLLGDTNKEITTLVYDSRKVVDGSVFVCIKGAKADGHNYIDQVINDGATVVVIEREIEIDIKSYEKYENTVTFLQVDDTRKALAFMSAAYFGYPAEKLKTIGITGTKGKTTTTYMVKDMLDKAGHKAGLIGTIETIIGETAIKSVNTTPESYVLQESFAKMLEAGCDCVVMEVSSQGLMLHRVDGFTFDYGIFSNLEADHIGPNEHKDFEDYLHCKAMLFKQCKVGIINIDDKYAKDVIEGHTCKIETFGMTDEAMLRAENIKLTSDAGKLGVKYDVKGLMDFNVQISVPGKFSVYNSLMAIAIARHFNIDVDIIRETMKNVKVKGRVEIVPTGSDDYTIIIDYAHNSMSMKSLLTTIREYKPKRLVTVFGCGGNRDKHRRYDMGEISSQYADLSVLTSDNPRTEEPEDIINDILVGIHKHDGKYITIVDRKEAIKYCIDNAQKGDVILLVGKGHESYQDIKGVKYDFDERKVVADIVNNKN